MTRSTDAGISQRTNVYAERQMLKHAAPVVILDKFGLSKPMPKNKSTTIKFRRPRTFTAATTPLVEGVTPQETTFSYEDVSVELKQYGQIATVTDVIEDTHEDPVLNDITMMLGENVGRTTEALTYAVLKGGTNVFYANGTTRSDVNTPVTLSALRAIVRALKSQKAMMISNILAGSPNYGTRPIERAYVAVCHTDVENDIRNLPGFIPVAEYGSQQTIHETELGQVESLRFLISPDLGPIADAGGAKAGSGTTMVSASGTSSDVYPILIFGREAYGIVPLRGQGAIEPTIIPVNQKTKDDPLGQRGVAGWKMWHASVILNELWMARLEVAVTDLQ
jgi:N4-gp56 family major capsid protein